MIKNKLKTIDWKIKTKQGFVSLFAVLISLVILAITIGISTVAFKENILAQSSREGSYAFFAADTGLECALYHDSNGSFTKLLNLEAVPDFNCANVSPFPNTNPGISTVDFQFDLNMAGGDRCVEVSVNKNAQIDDPANPGNLISATQIYSNGYNISCTDVANILSIPNSRIVNRLLIATYPNPIPPPPVGP